MSRPLEGKTGVVLGVANERSIAWAIAREVHAQGARVALNYQGERLAEQVGALGAQIDALCLPCDLTDEAQIDTFFAGVGEAFGGKLDFLVHSVAFARREDLTGRFVNIPREGFLLAQEVSVYSLVAATRRAFPMFQATGAGSVVTLTYFGAEKVIPNYNVMGVAKAALEASVRYLAADLGKDNVRVNGLSAGPIKTLASRAIGQFSTLLSTAAERTPMKRNIETEEVAKVAAFLASDGASGITGETLYVDCGYNIMGY
jgi:enoyl-[acyl-carrier protein] reductase I